MPIHNFQYSEFVSKFRRARFRNFLIMYNLSRNPESTKNFVDSGCKASCMPFQPQAEISTWIIKVILGRIPGYYLLDLGCGQKITIDRLRLRWQPRVSICWFVDGNLRFATQGCTMPGKKTTHPHILSPKFVVKNSWWIESHGESNPYQKNHQQNRITNKIECFYPKFLPSSLGSPNCMILIAIYTLPETNSHFGNLKKWHQEKESLLSIKFQVQTRS